MDRDFTNISQADINKAVNWVNRLFRGSLGYLSAEEVYNVCVSN
jgi:IS30 family transposase